MDRLISSFLILFSVSSPISISVSEGALLFALLFWIAKMIKERRFLFRDNPLNLSITLFLFITFIGVFFSRDIGVSLSGFRAEWTVLCFFLFSANAKEKKWLFIKCLLVSSAIAGLYGVFQHFSGLDPILNKYTPPRATGFFGCMTFGNYQALVLSFSLPILVHIARKGFLHFIGALFLASSIFGGLLFSFTRGAWLGFLCSLIWFCILKNKKILFLLIPICFAIYLLSADLKTRFISIVDKGSHGWREYMWSSGWNMFKKHPIFGVGIDNYPRYVREYLPNSLSSNEKECIVNIACHSHSNYIQLLSERGIFAFLGFLFILATFLRKTGSLIKTSADEFSSSILLGGQSAVICFLVSGITEYTYGDSEVIMLFWLILGLTLSVQTLKNRPQRM
jgi:O-antigen ligase